MSPAMFLKILRYEPNGSLLGYGKNKTKLDKTTFWLVQYSELCSSVVEDQKCHNALQHFKTMEKVFHHSSELENCYDILQVSYTV